MKWVSSVGNKGQTKPEFLVSNFKVHTLQGSISVQTVEQSEKKNLALDIYNPFVYYTNLYILGSRGV